MQADAGVRLMYLISNLSIFCGRFVRFVSTPEVLERFARLEKEILQIESSVQPNESANSIVVGQAEEGIQDILFCLKS